MMTFYSLLTSSLLIIMYRLPVFYTIIAIGLNRPTLTVMGFFPYALIPIRGSLVEPQLTLRFHFSHHTEDEGPYLSF